MENTVDKAHCKEFHQLHYEEENQCSFKWWLHICI